MATDFPHHTHSVQEHAEFARMFKSLKPEDQATFLREVASASTLSAAELQQRLVSIDTGIAHLKELSSLRPSWEQPLKGLTVRQDGQAARLNAQDVELDLLRVRVDRIEEANRSSAGSNIFWALIGVMMVSSIMKAVLAPAT